VVGVAALIGGRLYHVIDQWDQYAGDPLSIVLPPYSGLGVYGGILTGTIAAWVYIKRNNLPFWTWADIIAPGLFVMQAIGRWGNFFNQELYGPPTDLPWGIAIDCMHRVPEYPCTLYPFETTFFQPLFLYESISGALGAAFLLWLGLRHRDRLRPGDLLLVFFIWYAAVRFALESLRTGNWTFFGIPTAMLISAVVAIGALAVLAYRHTRPAPEPDVDEDDGEEWDDEDDESGEGHDAAEVASGDTDGAPEPAATSEPEEPAEPEEPDEPEEPAEPAEPVDRPGPA
jgi:phosphatidylglycerol:prolipoprotein diacylglycerol transferase